MDSLILLRPLRLARAYPREAAIALGAVAFSAAAMASVTNLSSEGSRASLLSKPVVTEGALPPPPENGVVNVAPEQAVAINRQIPVSEDRGPAATPFTMAGVNPNTRQSALACLAQAVYYEAGQESDEGQRGVAQVVLNRVRHPAFPATVCGVVYQGSTRPTGCQFTFTCDGSLARRPDRAGWARAYHVAVAVLSGEVAASVGYATHYHADYVLPTWANTLAKTDVIGAHLFYRWKGGWGQPTAFSQRYLRHEASPAGLGSAALAAHAAYLAAGTPTAARGTPVAAAQNGGLPIAQQGDGRVSLHFTPQARAAVEAAVAKPRDDKDPAREQAVRTLLDAGSPASDERPLG